MVKILIEKSQYVILISSLAVISLAVVFAGVKDIGVINPHFDLKNLKYMATGTKYYTKNSLENITTSNKFYKTETDPDFARRNKSMIIDICYSIKNKVIDFHFNYAPTCKKLGVNVD